MQVALDFYRKSVFGQRHNASPSKVKISLLMMDVPRAASLTVSLQSNMSCCGTEHGVVLEKNFLTFTHKPSS